MVLFLTHRFRPNEELSRICQELWDLDDNRLKPGVDYVIDLQVRMGSPRGFPLSMPVDIDSLGYLCCT